MRKKETPSVSVRLGADIVDCVRTSAAMNGRTIRRQAEMLLVDALKLEQLKLTSPPD